MNMVNISDIIIPDGYTMTIPQEQKMEKVRAYIKEHGDLDKPIVLNGNRLVDGYTRYLAAKELGLDEVWCITPKEYHEMCKQKTPTYMIGKFEGCDKEYTWRVIKNIHLEPGDKVLVKSKKHKNGKDNTYVTVVRVFESDDVSMLRHKPIIKKLKRKIAEDKKDSAIEME